MSIVKKKEQTNRLKHFFSHCKVLSVKISNNQMLRKKNKQMNKYSNTYTSK